jgi:hypothetical protein
LKTPKVRVEPPATLEWTVATPIWLSCWQFSPDRLSSKGESRGVWKFAWLHFWVFDQPRGKVDVDVPDVSVADRDSWLVRTLPSEVQVERGDDRVRVRAGGSVGGGTAFTVHGDVEARGAG